MEFGSNCSGDCFDCSIHYSIGGSCLAGHDDDYFSKVTKENIIEFINIAKKYSPGKGFSKCQIINIKERFPEIMNEVNSFMNSLN